MTLKRCRLLLKQWNDKDFPGLSVFYSLLESSKDPQLVLKYSKTLIELDSDLCFKVSLC